ncbi:MAG: CHAT domain-containing protein, partial [Anaerolineales bacterium]|nr:CHAT domain-containing protein [Anaerolineales bacterium]
MTSYNFDLLISPPDANSRYPVRVIGSPAGASEEVSYQSFNGRSIDELLLFTQELVAEQEDMYELGQVLFDFLFSANIKQLFDQSRGQLKADDLLRVRLRWDSLGVMNDLGRLPWEYLCDGKEFLALEPQLSLVRFLHDRPPKSLAIPETLRVLAVTAAPGNMPPLDLASELTKLETAVQTIQGAHPIELRVEENVTPRKLREAIDRWQPHVLHYAGHGRQGKQMGELVLVDDEGQAYLLPAHELRIMLKGGPVRMAILNACETAATPKDGDTANAAVQSVAGQLVRAGLPAVIGMQYKLPDTVAHQFLTDLYRAIATDHPLDEALTRTRKGLYVDQKDKNFWAIPALFLQVSDGRIFNPAAASEEEIEAADPNAEPPFKGLESFTMADADLFFGREALSSELVDRLHGDDILAVIGASGSGKSSVVQVGVAPVFTGDKPIAGMPPPRGIWQVRVFTPTAEPLTSLARTIYPQAAEETVQTFIRHLANREPEALAAAVRAQLGGGNHKLLLIVDQFEELF